jgi:NADH:ubiquinone oxidoreductase subunit 5 (subunit L)/multisubunit Na+/H+ antiporter MnhA subunit
MSPLYNVAWAVLLLPLFGAFASFLFETPRRAAHAVVACNGAGLLAAIFTLFFRIAHRHDKVSDGLLGFLQTNPSGGPNSVQFAATFQPQLGIRVDNFSAAFAAVVMFVAVLVLWHATSSMRKDAAYRRIFWCSSLLIFAVVGAVMSPNLFQMVFMFMLASSTTYILMTHWWEDGEVAEKARRGLAWLLAGDAALLVSMVVVFARIAPDAAAQPVAGSQSLNDPFDFSVIGTEVTRITSHAVPGVGSKTVAVIGILVAIAALIRLAVVPAVAWLGAAVEAPLPATAMALSLVSGTGAILLARMWPVLLAVPHELSVIALIGVASAVICAAVALTLRDIAHFCVWISGAQLGVVVATFGVGGYAPALEELSIFFVLNSVLILTCGNLVRIFATRDIKEMGGAWRRAHATAIPMAIWAVFIAGLDMSNYNAISVVLRNRFASQPATASGGAVSGGVQTAVLLGVVAAALLIVVAAVRVAVLTCRGEPVSRRGFNTDRVRNVEPRAVGTVLVLIGGLAALVATGIPAFVKGWTFSHFVFFGEPPLLPQSLPVVGTAVVLAIAVGAAGLVAWSWYAGARRVEAPRANAWVRIAQRQLGIETGLARVTEGASAFVADILRGADSLVADRLEDVAGENFGIAGALAGRARTGRLVYQLLAAVAILAVAVSIAVFAAAGGRL